MSAYSTSIKDYVARYRQEVGDQGLIDPHEVAGWAYKHGLHNQARVTRTQRENDHRYYCC